MEGSARIIKWTLTRWYFWVVVALSIFWFIKTNFPSTNLVYTTFNFLSLLSINGLIFFGIANLKED